MVADLWVWDTCEGFQSPLRFKQLSLCNSNTKKDNDYINIPACKEQLVFCYDEKIIDCQLCNMRIWDLVDFNVLFVWYLMTWMLVLHALRSEGEGDKIMEEVMGFGTYIVFMLSLWNFDS